MTRTVAREIAIHFAFELGFSDQNAQAHLEERLKPEVFQSLAEEEPLYGEFPNRNQQNYIRRLVCGVGEHGAELDAYIERYAVGWRFSRISRVAAAIMRVAMYELLYMPEIPPAAAINEAVELSKSYEPPEVTSFINGILGTFWRTEGAALSVMPGGTQPAGAADANFQKNEASAMKQETKKEQKTMPQGLDNLEQMTKQPYVQNKEQVPPKTPEEQRGAPSVAPAANGPQKAWQDPRDQAVAAHPLHGAPVDKVLEEEETKKVPERERSAEQVRPWEWESDKV